MKGRLPAWAAALLLATTAWAGPFRDTGDGISVRQDRVPTEPWAIQIVRFERSRTNLVLQPLLSLGDRIGLATLTEQVALVPPALGTPLAAINGDFYQTENETFPGDPRGLFIRRGELVSAPAERDCFWIDPQGQPQIGTIRSDFSITWPDGETTPLGLNEEPEGDAVLFTPAASDAADGGRGPRLVLERATDTGPWLPLRVGETYQAKAAADGKTKGRLVLVLSPSLRSKAATLKAGGVVQISTRTTPDLRGVTTAIGGGPALVRAGKVQRARALKSNERHPRSALGWNAEHFFLVVVDGRQPRHSMGMTLPELGQYLAELGCTEAINLDGGASTELWLRGKILNRPCSGQERNTATTLVLLKSGTNAPATSPGSR